MGCPYCSSEVPEEYHEKDCPLTTQTSLRTEVRILTQSLDETTKEVTASCLVIKELASTIADMKEACSKGDCKKAIAIAEKGSFN